MQQIPIDGAVGAVLVSHLFSGLWLEFGGNKKKNKTTKSLMLSFHPRCSAHTEPVTI